MTTQKVIAGAARCRGGLPRRRSYQRMLGIDDQAVERTNRIDGRGYGFRIRWKEILDGRRSADSAYINAVKLSLAYAVGNPGKLQETGEQRKSLVFVTTSGLYPWDERMDNMKSQTDKMLAESAAEDKLKALEAKKPETIETATDSEVPESLELVQEPPENFTGGRR